jgi:hypothetical protein
MTATLPRTAEFVPADATASSTRLRRVTGILFAVGAIAFGISASVLSATFDWPDILREDPSVVLPAFAAGGETLAWTWFATAWTYGLLAVPLLLLPRVLGRAGDPVLRVATTIGAASVAFSVIGFLRWVFVVPSLAASWTAGDSTTKAAVEAAWMAQHQFGGALLGEHLGELLGIVWSVAVSVLILRTRVLPVWLGVVGVVTSLLYLLNQGDVMHTAFPSFPVVDWAGLIGSTGWGLWVAALGVVLVLRRPRAASS